jgi:hypothetical protein
MWLLVSVVIWWTLFHIAFLAEPRYHVPLYPILSIAFAAGARIAGAKLVALRKRPSTSTGAVSS